MTTDSTTGRCDSEPGVGLSATQLPEYDPKVHDLRALSPEDREQQLADLRAHIADRLASRAVSLAADAVVLRPRHEASLRAAADDLAEARALVAARREGAAGVPMPELVAASMRGALDQITVLSGRISEDDVLGRVFARFCVGK